jgi:hypothetical protein
LLTPLGQASPPAGEPGDPADEAAQLAERADAPPTATPAEPDEAALPRALALCATVAARIDLQPDARDDVLTEARLDAEQWTASTEHWEAVIAGELGAGIQQTLKCFDAAYVAEIERVRGPIEPERAAERGRMAEMLRTHRLPIEGWMRIKRTWIRTLCLEPALRARYFAALARP